MCASTNLLIDELLWEIACMSCVSVMGASTNFLIDGILWKRPCKSCLSLIHAGGIRFTNS